ncbi:MAG: cell division ATP-binding protein FtsE [Clostridia bacterium]
MIEFKNVTKQYDHGVTALDSINIKIEKGEFVFFVGPSGSGKSTLLKLIIKEEDPTRGTVIVNANDLTNMKDKNIPFLRRNIGFVFQDFRLIYDRTVYENIAFALHVIEAKESDITKKVREVLELVGLSTKAYAFPNQLSGGEQQRVSLARAIVTNPPIVIADEPTGNLDSDTAVDIMNRLYDLNSKGTTVIVVSHDRDMITKSGMRVIQMNKGKVIADEKMTRSVTENVNVNIKTEASSQDKPYSSRRMNMGGGF